jgi:hypothetical protein
MAGGGALAFYAQHSLITEPGRFAHELDALPTQVGTLVGVVRWLFIHPVAAAKRGLSAQEPPAQRVRFIIDLLQYVFELCPEPLTRPRDANLRVRGNCRTAATLLVAFLRHHGVPACKRTGFARYIDFIHEIVDYWDAATHRWLLVDPDVGDDPNEADALVLGGDDWQRCRAGRADPADFRGAGKSDGLPGVRQALLQDLDGLNGIELTSHDWWGGALDDTPHADLTASDLATLNDAAELILAVDSRFEELRQFYADLPHGQNVLRHLASQCQREG